ncbi:uncharacterized protein LOC124442185 [Xenia sp. Carnegie-2017]|uniref:uncharacterized protein LOC124442185 n=1 Tax=Xenia sp. Carnegie-2017 TaxID=2897299 RepID=UPI001F049725|nr:uncharacterized protein LOC124442185 [Xenia sp. Carnegie-2017]
MYFNLTRNNSEPNFFDLGWFDFPTNVVDNYEVMVAVHNILVLLSLLSNLILLYVIYKTFHSTGKNNSLLLICTCICNIFVYGFAILNMIFRFGTAFMVRGLSIYLPTYYLITLGLALNNYGLIVTPIKFQVLSPKPRTVIAIVGPVWIILSFVLLIVPSFVKDIQLYTKTLLTTEVGICWIVTIILSLLYFKITKTLYHRKKTLLKTFNLSEQQQGSVIIAKNSRLAKVMFIYNLELIVLTLPIYTCVVIQSIVYDGENLTLSRIIFILIPLVISLPLVHVIHWLFVSPQYYQEIKRIVGKILNLFQRKSQEQ